MAILDQLSISSQLSRSSQHTLNLDCFNVFESVAEMEQNNRLIEGQIEQAIWQERERLARELHDTVVPEIYTIGLFIEALELALKAGKQETVSKYLAELRTAARESLAGLRLILLGLRPPILDDVGIAEALHQWLDLVQARFGVQTELNVDGSWMLDENVEEALYRITQEAVNNSLKHARATNVFVELLNSDHTTCLSVKDDGSGFDLGAVDTISGFGLRNMQERAASIHASLEIDTAPGKGTRICVVVTDGAGPEHSNE
jgi:signal transduction histidine kinase